MNHVRTRTPGHVFTRVGSSLLAALLVALAASSRADAQVTTRDEIDPASAAFAEAAEQGLVMNGYRDEGGLKRILERHFQNASLFGTPEADRRLNRAPDGRVAEIAEAFREAGIDPEIMREMESLVRGMDVSIHRVEYMPGFTGLDVPGAPNADPGAQGLEDDGGLTPGIPRGESLASSDNTYRVYHSYEDGGRTRERGYRDGSTWYHAEGRTADGGYMRYDRVTNRDGSTRYYRLTITDGEDGDIRSHVEERQEGRPITQAEKDHQRSTGYQHPDDEGPDDQGTPAEGEEAGGEEQGGGEGDGNGSDEDLDQYQPAEGGEGTFCPLILEHCRRALEEMGESREEILVGTVLVNPGDPDDQPKGSRLVYDPENLVINPDPETSRGEARRLGSRRFWMSIPVWVNPPGPNEP